MVHIASQQNGTTLSCRLLTLSVYTDADSVLLLPLLPTPRWISFDPPSSWPERLHRRQGIVEAQQGHIEWVLQKEVSV